MAANCSTTQIQQVKNDLFKLGNNFSYQPVYITKLLKSGRMAWTSPGLDSPEILLVSPSSVFTKMLQL